MKNNLTLKLKKKKPKSLEAKKEQNKLNAATKIGNQLILDNLYLT
jgi:hypothetical protein